MVKLEATGDSKSVPGALERVRGRTYKQTTTSSPNAHHTSTRVVDRKDKVPSSILLKGKTMKTDYETEEKIQSA